MRFQKFISTILHPIVIPTLGVFLYFMFVSQSLERRLQLVVLGLVFVVTYIIPVFLLVFLKALELLKVFKFRPLKKGEFLFFLWLLFSIF